MMTSLLLVVRLEITLVARAGDGARMKEEGGFGGCLGWRRCGVIDVWGL